MKTAPSRAARSNTSPSLPRSLAPFPGTILTGIFAVSILIFGIAGGNMFQANQTFAQMRNVTGGDEGFLGGAGAALIFGVILAALVAAVILGGMKSIGATTSKLVPAMAFIYVLACLFVIFVNLGQVPAAFGAIITGAFNPSGMAGGLVGVMIVGFQRAAFSNEADLGGGDRPLHRQDAPSRERRVRCDVRAPGGHRHHLHHDRPGHRHCRSAEPPGRH